VDVVVSNCVLNLVEAGFKRRLFEEIFRVLRKGGRASFSDIVSDEPVPENLQNDPELWSGCVSGALTEAEFLRAFTSAGFMAPDFEAGRPAMAHRRGDRVPFDDWSPLTKASRVHASSATRP